jgi:hypothetical protein
VVPVKGGPAGPSEASREAAPLTGRGARSYAVLPGRIGPRRRSQGVRRPENAPEGKCTSAWSIEPIIKQLPMEYAVEMNRLIELQMEGSIG